ncbi:MAG TPA: lipocalin family protein [Blastocatellia bacterium]|nr:lipocalin family protein [Blastocatellia bacterium]
MNSRTLSRAAIVVALTLYFNANAGAQSADRIGETWKGPDPSLITSILKNREKSRSPSGAARPSSGVVKFTPVGDSGVANSLADAFGRNEGEKAAVAEAFKQIKQGYEAEVAKEGRSNNLAAAMTFFIAANVAAYHQTDMPSDKAGEQLFQSLQIAMASTAAFARLSNSEKQQMHDWLVCMAGFVMTGYADARQTGDKEGLRNFRQLADYSIRLVLGVDIGKLSFTGDKLAIAGDATESQTGNATTNSVVGVWSKSSSSPVGMAGTLDATQKSATYAGYYKGQYDFKPDGTYTFKAERRAGSSGQGFWTTEESGTYAVSGDSLTISPRVSKATLRNLEGVIQQSQNNQLETVTYKWRLHYFEGLNETQLVLQTARQTTRDGGFAGNSNFPNSYLYSPGSRLEFRY